MSSVGVPHIGCHSIGVREEEDFVLIISTIVFIIFEVGEASQGKSWIVQHCSGRGCYVHEVSFISR